MFLSPRVQRRGRRALAGLARPGCHRAWFVAQAAGMKSVARRVATGCGRARQHGVQAWTAKSKWGR
eukprot:1464546-Lingulodinium_polyedra.AAC.1